MSNDERIVSLLTDMLVEQKETNKNLQSLNVRVEHLEQQQAKTNVELSDMRLAIMKMADKFEEVSELRGRVMRLEDEVFKH
ncbi:MAG: hypothetical protein V4642_02515 [Bacteroidota bacterium]